MPAATKTPSKDKLRHEEFCQPRPDSDEVRVESYPYLADDLETGRSRPVSMVTRCVECGATTYSDQKEN